jgi:hypothetical protein
VVWKGRRLTKVLDVARKAQRQDEDPGTARLRAELEAKAKAEAKQRKAARKEAAQIRAKQRAKPATEQEASMATKKTKTAKKSRSAARQPVGKAKPAAKAPAKGAAKPQRAPSSAPREKGGVRPGSKLEIIVGLLTRPQGCTTAEVLKATDWPAVSMPQQARAAGLTLQKEKKDGVTVYRATKAA